MPTALAVSQHVGALGNEFVQALAPGSEAAARFRSIASHPGLQSWLVSRGRLLGLLSHTVVILDRPMEHFYDALAFSRKAGHLALA